MMSMFLITAEIINRLASGETFCGRKLRKKCYNLVNWRVVLPGKRYGGTGIKNLKV